MAHFDTINCLLSSVLCALCNVNAMNDRPSTLLINNCICVAIKISMLFHVRLSVIQIEKENALNTSSSSLSSLLLSSLSYNNRKIKRKLTVLISHIHTIVLSIETSSLFFLLLLLFFCSYRPKCLYIRQFFWKICWNTNGFRIVWRILLCSWMLSIHTCGMRVNVLVTERVS